MGTGWRRAFCTTISRERREPSAAAAAPSPEKLARSNPSTPRLPPCKMTTDENNIRLFGSNPSSPRSPFSILRNTVLRLSRSSCGVCTQSVKAGQGKAIYTAECSHAFHFPCIASHVRKQSRLICPVCKTVWKDVPFLAVHALHQNRDSQPPQQQHEKIIFIDSTAPPKHAPVSSPKFSPRSYADDEPLRTLKSSANFVPLPEKDEGDDEVREFQGFLVDPISSTDDFFRSNGSGNLRKVELSLSPEAAVISQGRTHDTYAVVLRVKAPPVSESARRAPIDLVTVLDVSDSMTGAKLEMLKRAMRLVVSSLRSADRLSVVAFSAEPRRLLPLTRMTGNGQRVARRIIDRLSCSRGCSMAEALKQATRVLEERRERNPVASIILLSDGQDNGVPDTSDCDRRRGSSHGTRFSHVEIPVHSTGFSREPAEDAFSKCVSGLLSVVVQDLRIQIGFTSGSDPAEITAIYSRGERPTLLGSGCIRLGDLYAEEEKKLLLEIRVPAGRVGSHLVISAKCSYNDPANGELIYGSDHALLVPRPLTVRSGMPRIERLRGAFISSRAVAESRRLIEYCEFSSAMQLLSSARALLLQSNSESVGEYVKGLEVEMAEVQRRRAEEIE